MALYVKAFVKADSYDAERPNGFSPFSFKENCLYRGRRLTSIEATRVVGLIEDEAAEKLGPIGLRLTRSGAPWGRSKTKLPSIWGRFSRRMTSSEARRAVGSAEVEGCGTVRLYRSKAHGRQGLEGRGVLKPTADKQRGQDSHGVERRRSCRAARTVLAED